MQVVIQTICHSNLLFKFALSHRNKSYVFRSNQRRRKNHKVIPESIRSSQQQVIRIWADVRTPRPTGDARTKSKSHTVRAINSIISRPYVRWPGRGNIAICSVRPSGAVQV